MLLGSAARSSQCNRIILIPKVAGMALDVADQLFNLHVELSAFPDLWFMGCRRWVGITLKAPAVHIPDGVPVLVEPRVLKLACLQAIVPCTGR